MDDIGTASDYKGIRAPIRTTCSDHYVVCEPKASTIGLRLPGFRFTHADGGALSQSAVSWAFYRYFDHFSASHRDKLRYLPTNTITTIYQLNIDMMDSKAMRRKRYRSSVMISLSLWY